MMARTLMYGMRIMVATPALSLINVCLGLPGTNAYSNPKDSSPATEAFVLVFILRSQSNTMGNKPKIQSAVNDTTE